MQPTCVIAWKSKSRGSIGQGKTLFTREEAEQVANELNQDHPDFVHEPLDTSSPSNTHIAQPEVPEQPPAESLIIFPSAEEVFA